MGWPDLVFSGEHDAAALSRAAARGTLRRLARGIYTGDLRTPAEEIVHRHLWPIVGHEFPGAVFVDRSVPAGGMPADDAVFVDHARQRPVTLPGVTIWPRRGPGAVAGDISLPNGLAMSSTARALLDNLVSVRRSARVRRTLEQVEVEDWIDTVLRRDGEDQLNAVRDHARRLAPVLGRRAEMKLLDRLIDAAPSTQDDVLIESDALRARRAGELFDPTRVELFETLTDQLMRTAPHSTPALPVDAPRRPLLPFYEAYFSNYIEGTEFTLDEAADIVFNHAVPSERPEDAHDVLGTYEIVSTPEEMRRIPHSFDELDELLRYRHAVLMAGRPDKRPGQYKVRANRAGATEFVAHELVPGTLRRGLDVGARLESPFSRAVYMMFLIAEVHPFADGNGRVARIFMNAELEAGGEVRMIIPTVYRNNYLSALRPRTHGAHFGALIAMLSFAQRYTARIDFSDRARAVADLERTNAFRDPTEAEAAGIRLVLP